MKRGWLFFILFFVMASYIVHSQGVDYPSWCDISTNCPLGEYDNIARASNIFNNYGCWGFKSGVAYELRISCCLYPYPIGGNGGDSDKLAQDKKKCAPGTEGTKIFCEDGEVVDKPEDCPGGKGACVGLVKCPIEPPKCPEGYFCSGSCSEVDEGRRCTLGYRCELDVKRCVDRTTQTIKYSPPPGECSGRVCRVPIPEGKVKCIEVLEEDPSCDVDEDGHITSKYGGDDCNDDDETVYPGAPDYCDNIIPNACGEWAKEDGHDEKWFNAPTTCGEGECKSEGMYLCEAGKKIDSCKPKKAADEICDGKNNDCDLETDEGCQCKISDPPLECGIDVGECKKGAQTCTAGKLSKCLDAVGPSDEICDGKDNDCDGMTDEDSSNSGDYTIKKECNKNSCEGTITCTADKSENCILKNDADKDGYCSEIDNCPNKYNADQKDSDHDNLGDTCDNCPYDSNNDIDDDGVCGNVDNCGNKYNADQKNTDNDGLGDACDSCPSDPLNDIDKDGVCGNGDNCPSTYNPGQNDCNNNNKGDACDTNSDCSVDTDKDGIKDTQDNCPAISNQNQADSDNDDVGNACDSCPSDPFNDVDSDNVCGNVDNCPDKYNPDQKDTDKDGIADACDACSLDINNDMDADNICGDTDNCPSNYNPSQNDCNMNSIGDACDKNSTCSTDSDKDGTIDSIDNCADYYNPDQKDSDKDNIGDTCDPCYLDPFNDVDKDTVCGNVDTCPTVFNPDQKDSDNDGTGDACDICELDQLNDVDKDSVCGDKDNCPIKNNPEQYDCDSNGIGDACDPSNVCTTNQDGDNIDDNKDNCPEDYNPDQMDNDGDGIGDICDKCQKDALNDIDNDGVCGNIDNCPTISNQNQVDNDMDGLGDSCDKCNFDKNNDEDKDLICGEIDNCGSNYNPSQKDCDSNGLGDACDDNSKCSGDIDTDGHPDYKDNCPETYNPDQKDSDSDELGDSCDICVSDPFNDKDNDGVCGNVDNCQIAYNPGQKDSDFDGRGDHCDLCPFDKNNDIDGDGICGDVDNCPVTYNPGQEICKEIQTKEDIFDKKITIGQAKEDELKNLLDLSFIKNITKDALKNSENIKKRMILETKEYEKGGKTFTTCKITLNTEKPMGDFVYLQNIPKCLAMKAENIYFNGKNYNILENDPIIAWHFTEVKEKLEMSYEVE